MALYNDYYPLIPFEFDKIISETALLEETGKVTIQEGLDSIAENDNVFVLRYVLTQQYDNTSGELKKATIWQKQIKDGAMCYALIAELGSGNTINIENQLIWHEIE